MPPPAPAAAYLQQLEMESNGKSVDRGESTLAYATCPVLFGAEGTPAQHAFMQLLHQGTQAVAADFIDCSVNEALSANAHAQADALAFGTTDAELPRTGAPRQPASSILKFNQFRPGPRRSGALRAQDSRGCPVEHQQLRSVASTGKQLATGILKESPIDPETFNLSIASPENVGVTAALVDQRCKGARIAAHHGMNFPSKSRGILCAC